MSEEATTGVTNWTEVQPAFRNYVDHSLVHLAQTINDTAPEVANILNRMSSQVTKVVFRKSMYFLNFLMEDQL